jgi:hypothetical protein
MVVLPVGDRGQSERHRPVLHQRVDGEAREDANEARHPEARAPAEPGDEQRDHVVGEPFAHGVGRTPDAVEATALAVAEPGGERHRAGRRAETLEPAVERPERDRGPQDRRKAHADVDQRRGDDAGREEDLDVRVVGEETVDELGEGVRVEEGGADETEVLRRKDAFVDQRLLDDRKRQPAGVGEGVAEGDRQHHPHPVLAEQGIDPPGVGDTRRRCAGFKPFEPCRHLNAYSRACLWLKQNFHFV